MKVILTPLSLILTAGAALAHSGAEAHIHPHVNDPTWVPILAGFLVICGAAAMIWRRK
jgi:cytochrome c biogenesis factor